MLRNDNSNSVIKNIIINPKFPTETMACTIVCLGSVEKRLSFDEWPLGSICSFWLWLMRCMTVQRLIQVMETHGRFCSICVYARQPCVSDIMWSTGIGTRHPVVAGTGTSSWVIEEKASGERGCVEEGGSREQQVNTCSQQVADSYR